MKSKLVMFPVHLCVLSDSNYALFCCCFSAKVETDDLDTVTHMKPGIDVCPIQLAVLSHSLHILQNMCLWPLDKSRLGFGTNRIDLTTFTDDEKRMCRNQK